MGQSLRRGLEILEYTATRGGSASVTETATFLGVDPSTSSRLMTTLKAMGFLIQDPDTRRYQLGTKLLQLSNTVLHNLSVVGLAHDLLRGLAQVTGESAHLAILVNDVAVFLDRYASSAAIVVNTEIGSTDPAYCSAIGRALLTGLRDEDIRQRLSNSFLARRTARTLTSLDDIIERVRTARTAGYAFDDEEANDGVQCIAAPVYDHLDRVVAAIGISTPTLRIKRLSQLEMASAVLQTSKRLSARLAHPHNEHDTGTRPLAAPRS